MTKSWVFIDKKSDTPDKIKLKEFCLNGIKGLNERIKLYDYLFDTTDLISFLKIRDDADKLVDKQKHTMNALNNFASYNDPLIVFDVIPTVEENGEMIALTNNIILELNKLIQKKTQEYIDLIGKQSINLSTTESLKLKKIRQLLELFNVSSEIKEILTINNKSGLSRNYLEKTIYEILLQKYDKYYTNSEIDDLIAFYKTKTGNRMIKVSKIMMIETLTEIMNCNDQPLKRNDLAIMGLHGNVKILITPTEEDCNWNTNFDSTNFNKQGYIATNYSHSKSYDQNGTNRYICEIATYFYDEHNDLLKIIHYNALSKSVFQIDS